MSVYCYSLLCQDLLWWFAGSLPCCSEALGCAVPSVWMCTPQAEGSPERQGAGPPWWKYPGWHSTSLGDALLNADAPTGKRGGKIFWKLP